MPRKSRLKAEVAPCVSEPFIPDVCVDFSPSEKEELRTFFNGPVWKKLLANVRMSRPSLFPSGMDTVMGPQIALSRLHQLQGWKMLEVALTQPILPPIAPRKTLMESYPDAGRQDFEAKSKNQ